MSEREDRIRSVLMTYFPMFIATLSLVTAIYNGYLNGKFVDIIQRNLGRAEHMRTCKEIIDAHGGRIRVEGTRITVHRIATLYKQGLTAEEIAQTYPHLSLSQVYTALAWYHANRDEIEAELAAMDAEYDELKRQASEAEDRVP
jgi:uncharacterized protein (DUF433 family)